MHEKIDQKMKQIFTQSGKLSAKMHITTVQTPEIESVKKQRGITLQKNLYENHISAGMLVVSVRLKFSRREYLYSIIKNYIFKSSEPHTLFIRTRASPD